MPAGDRLFGQQLIRRLRFLREAQWWPRERIEAYRAEALRALLATAHAEVPFYRELWDQHGVRVADIQNPAGLARLPFVTKNLIRPAYPDRITRPTGQKTYEVSSSGSTGANFRVREDFATAGHYRAAFMLVLEWSGWRTGVRHMQTGMTSRTSLDRRLKDFFFRTHYVRAFDLTDAHLDKALDELERHRIDHLWGYPGSIYYLARHARKRNWNRPLTGIVTWGDMLYPHQRREAESVFGTRVVDTYGCGEGIQVSAQCGFGDHYHTQDLDTVVEYVDDAGNPVPPGTPGNVLLTRLHPGPMPLIRYRVGDVATARAQLTCACGREWGQLESLQGRESDAVVTPDGNRLIVHFFTGILEYFTEVDQFQVVQTEADRLLVRILTADYSPELGRRIVQALASKGITGMTIEVEPVADIPASPSGKRRFVMSLLPKP
jgi:phenylacetate-CoA ligase